MRHPGSASCCQEKQSIMQTVFKMEKVSRDDIDKGILHIRIYSGPTKKLRLNLNHDFHLHLLSRLVASSPAMIDILEPCDL